MTTIQRPIAVMNSPGNRTGGSSTLFVTPPPGTEATARPGLLSAMPAIGIVPAGLLAYGLYSGRRGFIWVGGVWIAWMLYDQRVTIARALGGGQ